MSGHTPGPWRVYEGGNFIKVVPSDYPDNPDYLGGAVCDIDDMIGPPGRWVVGESRHQRWLGDNSGKVLEMRANAALISAAPEFLEYAKLEQQIDDFDCPHDAEARCRCGAVINEMIGRARSMRAAIVAKAEGREP